MSKKTMTKATKDTHVSGREFKDMILGESLSSYRAEACEYFVRWDRDERVGRTASRKAALVIGSHRLGGIVLYCRETRAGTHELRWNVRSRLTGGTKTASVKRNHKTPYPCTAVELSVFHHTQTKDSTSLATEARTQRGFIEGRTTLAEPSRTVDDDRDDEMSEPTQNDECRKAKGGRNSKRKELQAPLLPTTFSRASSTRPED